MLINVRSNSASFFLLLCLTFSHVDGFAKENDKPILSTQTVSELKELQNEMGRILPVTDAPDLYALVEKVFYRLSRAQESLTELNYVPINYVFILNSPFENAFVHTPSSTGVRVSTNLVFITTAMLRKLIDLDPVRLEVRYPDLTPAQRIEEEMVSGIHRLAGMLAHELAHPLDILMSYERHADSPMSIEKEYGKRGDQAREIRADIDGANLLRAANLPNISNLKAMERVLNPYARENTAMAALRTHPENSMRMTIMRMFLTLNRLSLGENHDSKPFLIEDFNASGIARPDQNRRGNRSLAVETADIAHGTADATA